MRLKEIDQLRDALFETINVVKKTAFTKEDIPDDSYLGGDLGIDSIEMLEIWFHLEKELSIKIGDDLKRDVYTIDQVLGVLKSVSSNCDQN